MVFRAKMAERIEVPFGLSISVDPRNHVLDVCPDHPKQGVIFREKDMPRHAR